MSDERPVTHVLANGRVVKSAVRRYRLRIGERVEELAAQVVRVGTRGTEVVLTDPTVSRLHFELAADEHGFRLRDLGSTNGTFVDGLRAADVYLRPGAVIRAGATELVFEPLDRTADVTLAAGDRFGDLLGASAAMRSLFATLEQISRSDVTVLIEGESGTGKELVASAIHRGGVRAAQPFVVFDCGAVTASLLEAELFGHERGAFTGARDARAGALEAAHGGTLFLDEIGELPIELQPKLLRFLESGQVRRLGASKWEQIDVRVIAATNRDLAREVNAASFREDLYYRLAVVRVVTPPLRDHVDDIPLLVEGFLTASYGGNRARAVAAIASLPDTVWSKLRAWHWRGNVRELRNVVARAVALSADGMPTDLAPASGITSITRGEPAATGSFTEQKTAVIDAFERSFLERALAATGGNVTAAATAADLDRSYFKRLLKKHGLES